MSRELATFGAILSFAIQVENEAAAFYEGAARAESNAQAQEALTALAKAHRKRQRDCERMRREQVTEMILEPIYGLREEDWHTDLSGADKRVAAGLEHKLGEFYTQAAAKVNLPEVARNLAKLAKEAMVLEGQARAAA